MFSKGLCLALDAVFSNGSPFGDNDIVEESRRSFVIRALVRDVVEYSGHYFIGIV